MVYEDRTCWVRKAVIYVPLFPSSQPISAPTLLGTSSCPSFIMIYSSHCQLQNCPFPSIYSNTDLRSLGKLLLKQGTVCNSVMVWYGKVVILQAIILKGLYTCPLKIEICKITTLNCQKTHLYFMFVLNLTTENKSIISETFHIYWRSYTSSLYGILNICSLITNHVVS